MECSSFVFPRSFRIPFRQIQVFSPRFSRTFGMRRIEEGRRRGHGDTPHLLQPARGGENGRQPGSLEPSITVRWDPRRVEKDVDGGSDPRVHRTFLFGPRSSSLFFFLVPSFVFVHRSGRSHVLGFDPGLSSIHLDRGWTDHLHRTIPFGIASYLRSIATKRGSERWRRYPFDEQETKQTTHVVHVSKWRDVCGRGRIPRTTGRRWKRQRKVERNETKHVCVDPSNGSSRNSAKHGARRIQGSRHEAREPNEQNQHAP